MNRLSRVFFSVVVLLSLLALFLTTRSDGSCHEGCLTKGNFTKYNDWELDYETDIAVCIDWARDIHVDQGGKCIAPRDSTRWMLQNAARYCGARDHRGENYPNVGTRVNPMPHLEPTKCSLYEE